MDDKIRSDPHSRREDPPQDPFPSPHAVRRSAQRLSPGATPLPAGRSPKNTMKHRHSPASHPTSPPAPDAPRDELVFTFRGTARKPYRVTLAHHAGHTTVHCTCTVGRRGSVCRHVLAILGRSVSGMFMMHDRSPDLALAAQWIAQSPIADALREWEHAERALLEAQEHLARTRRALACSLQGPAGDMPDAELGDPVSLIRQADI